VESSGQVLAQISTLSSSKTRLLTAYYQGDSHVGGYIGTDNSGLFGRPERHISGIAFGLNPDGPLITGTWEKSSWAKRLLIQAGENRPLRIGERLYFYDFRTSNGIRYYGYIKAKPAEKIAQN
jgi:hypothetical protein